MRQLVFIILTVIIFQEVSAQKINWSPELSIRGKAKMKRLLKMDSSSFSAVIAQYKTFGDPDANIQEFTLPDMNFGEEYTIQANDQNLESLVELGGQVYALFINTDTENSQVIANARLASNSAAKLTSIGSIDYKRANHKGTFDFVESQDYSKLLVIEYPPYEKYNMEKFRLTMYNDSLDELWATEIKLPYLDQEFKIVGNQVDKHGNVFLLTTYNNILSKQNKNRGISIKNYTVMVYSNQKNKLKEFDIQLKDKWVNGLNMSFNNEGDIVVGGFYNDSREGANSGTIYMTIDKDSIEIKSKSLNPFSAGFTNQLVYGRQQSKKIDLEDFHFDYFVNGHDGSMYMTAEQYFVRTSSYFDQRTGVTNYTYYYHYNDIIVVKIDSDGKELWTKKIAKKQVTSNDNGDYSGYIVTPNKNGISVFYNDNLKNFENNDTEEIRTMNNPQRSMTAMVNINKNGEIIKKPLFNLEEQETIILPKIGKNLNKQQFILLTKKSRVFRFASIVLEH
ncbi:MAG: hypothetical protein P8M05_04760 [Flavobacteriales bacterium]|nr:hypothetical protein [Flavobacteriales bacterium]